MNKSNFTLKLIDLINDTIKLSIWYEILVHEELAAKELIEKLKLKGTNIYYHLKQMVENELLVTKTHQVPHSNLIEKSYRINPRFYSFEEAEARKDIGENLLKVKEIMLFRLYETILFLNKQILAVSKMREEDIRQQIRDEKIALSQLIFIEEEDLREVNMELTQLKKRFNDLLRAKGRNVKTYMKDATHAVLLGFLPLDK